MKSHWPLLCGGGSKIIEMEKGSGHLQHRIKCEDPTLTPIESLLLFMRACALAIVGHVHTHTPAQNVCLISSAWSFSVVFSVLKSTI